jgi:hypothetical protein
MRYEERHYDYGLRGLRDATARRFTGGARRAQPAEDRLGGGFNGGFDRRAEPRTLRVTARYNREYVYGGRGEDNYPRNHEMFTGERPEQIGDYRYYRRPYTTIAGTRTFRGAPEPMGYDRDFDTYDRDFRRR